MTETWKPIPGFRGYEVSDQGRVRSFKKSRGAGVWTIEDNAQRVMKPSKDSNGYWNLALLNDGKRHRQRVGHLVLLAFVGPRPEGMETCHNNGDAGDDRLENLRYDTHAENMLDAKRHGSMIGSVSSFTEAEVVEMRQLRADGMIYREIAQECGCSVSYIDQICRGEACRSYGGPLAEKVRSKIDNEQTAEIRRRHTGGENQRVLADEFGLHHSMVSLICAGKRRSA